MNGDAVAALETTEIAQQSRKFVHSDIEFAIGDGYRRFGFRFRNKDERRFVLVLIEVPVHAIVRGVDLAAHEPFPERRIAGVEGGVPVLVPAQQVGVLSEAFRKIFLAEAFVDVGIGQICLADKFRGRIIVFFFPPMNCDLSLARFNYRIWLLKSSSHINHSLGFLNLLATPVVLRHCFLG